MRFRYIIRFLAPIFLMAALGATAQEADSFHVDSTGKLFVNPGTPVYIYLSTKPDGSDAVKLESLNPEDMPMHWDGHGPHFLTHLNLYLGRKIRFDLYADGIPPKTSPSFDTQKGIQKNDIIYISGVATLELNALDSHSGIRAIHYSVNESEYQSYNQPLVFDKEGEYTLKFYAVDNVGNKEDEGKRIIIVDTTPPETTLDIEGPKHENVVSAKSKLVLNATDEVGVQATYYAINDAKDARYRRAIPMSNLPEGEHTIEWYSVDIVGNEEEPQSFTFFVDRTPPMVFEEIAGNTYMVAGKEYSSGRSQLRVAAVDNKAGVKEIYYSINNKPFELYDKPIFLSEISGAVSIRSYAVDNVDNKGESDASGQEFTMPEIDITGPNISHSFTGKHITLRDTLWIGPETKVNITANDRGSGLNRIEYKINDESSISYQEPFTVKQAGYHKVNITAWDHVENLNVSSAEFGVDANAPELFHNFSVKPYKFIDIEGETIPVFSGGVKLYVAATDDIVGVDRITFSINESKERVYSQPISSFKASQTYSVKLRAIDKMGNEISKTIMFRVE
ncbi:MAG: OmpL47-type beta-barrel domain-containing protein [Bacteroidales bacterium]